METVPHPDLLLMEVARMAQLAEGPSAVRQVLLELFRDPSVNNKALSQRTELPVPVLTAVRGELRQQGMLAGDNRTFTPVGYRFVREGLGLRYDHDPVPDHVVWDKTLSSVPPEILNPTILGSLKEWVAKRPSPAFELDQSRASFETQVRRLLLLVKNGDLEGLSVLFLGDDDATSLFVAMTGVVQEIIVVDIDQRILDYLAVASQMLGGTPIKTYRHDLRSQLPEELHNRMDVVFTDPPYTFEGARLFFQRGRVALRQMGSKLYISFGPKEPTVLWNLQLACLNAGFHVWQTFRGFNFYQGNLRLGQFSNLYVYKAVQPPQLVPHYYPNSPFPRRIYTAEVREAGSPDIIPFTDEYDQAEERGVGYHLVTEFYDPQSPVLDDPPQLYRTTLTSCEEVGLTVVDSFMHTYAPHGISIIVVLAESHVGLHTWPEHHYLSLDVFVCDHPQKAHQLVKRLAQILEPSHVEQVSINRGVGHPS